MKIALIQQDIVWEDITANHDKVEGLLTKATDADVIVLPEMFTTGFTMNTALAETMDGPTVHKMKDWASQYDALIMGSIIIQDNGHFYNRMLAVRPDGQVEYYDKRHLFSYANEQAHYSPGTEARVVEYQGVRFMLQICYDVRFPVFVRYNEQLKYDVIVYVASFPNRRISAWNQLLPARAIENQCYVVAVNRYGMDGMDYYYDGASQLIDYTGQVVHKAPVQECVSIVEIDVDKVRKFRNDFRFLPDRDIQ